MSLNFMVVTAILFIHTPFFTPHAVWHVSYQSLSRSWHTDRDYSSYRSSNLEIGLTAGVIDRQGMLSPPWYLIPPLIYSEVRLRPGCPFSDLYFLLDLWDWILFAIFVISSYSIEYYPSFLWLGCILWLLDYRTGILWRTSVRVRYVLLVFLS
jgi:hypothetical protein